MAKLKQDSCYIIRPMRDSDTPQSIEIDRQAFPNQWPHPNYTSFKQELRNRLAHYVVACQQIEFVPPVTGETTANKNFWDKLRQLLNPDLSPDGQTPLSSKEYIMGMAGFWLMAGEAHITTIAISQKPA